MSWTRLMQGWSPPWTRRRRARVQQRLAVLAEQIQESERRAARQRLLEAARRRNVGSNWPGTTHGDTKGKHDDTRGKHDETRDKNDHMRDTSGWNAVTRPLPHVDRPLMTRGQAYRTRHTGPAA